MSKGKLTWERFAEAISAAEKAQLQAIIAQMNAPGADQNATRLAFFAFASPVLSRLGGGDPRPLWGALKRQHQPAKRDVQRVPFAELAERLPYPLGFKLRELLQAEQRMAEGEAEPQFAFELCAVMGVLVRLAALITIQGYARSKKNDAALNHTVVDKLRAPSDGGWLGVAQQLSKAIQGADAPLVQQVGAALAAKPALDPEVKRLAKATTTQAALQALVSFRNDLVHGEAISEARLTQARAQLRVAVRGFAWLADYRLEVRHAGRTWSLNGSVPQPAPDDDTLPEDEPCLVHRSEPDRRLSLSPLLRFRASDGTQSHDVELDELFFLNAGSLQRLSYIGYRAAHQVDGKALGSYEAFKSFLAQVPTPPIPQDPRIDFSGFAAFHSRLFVGREELLRDISARIASGADQYLVLRALAGMGKSAVCANLLQAYLNLHLPETERLPCAADGLVRSQDKWVFHFCMPTDGRNSPTVALRSLIAQLCDLFDLQRKDWLGLSAIGVVLFLGMASQQTGLLTTTVTNSGFLTGLYVIITPFLAVALLRERPHFIVWPAATLTLGGIYLLSGGSFSKLRTGDLLTILCAGFWALQVIMIGKFSRDTARPFTLSAVQFGVCAVLGLLVALALEPWKWEAIRSAMKEILYAGIFSSGVAFTLQAVAQRFTTGSQAAIFLSSEALFAALFGAVFLGERMGVKGYFGCALMFASMLLVELAPEWNKRSKQKRM